MVQVVLGLDVGETPRDIGFGAHAILGDAVLEIRNALLDERFFDNPLVVGAPHIRFYAGAPLIHSSGHRLGTLCLIDRQPKRLPPEEPEHLTTLARTVSLELENHQAGHGAWRSQGMVACDIRTSFPPPSPGTAPSACS